MGLNSRSYCSPRQNAPLVNLIDDKFAGALKALTKNSRSPISTSCAPTPGLVPTSTPAPAALYLIKKLFK